MKTWNTETRKANWTSLKQLAPTGKPLLRVRREGGEITRRRWLLVKFTFVFAQMIISASLISSENNSLPFQSSGTERDGSSLCCKWPSFSRAGTSVFLEKQTFILHLAAPNASFAAWYSTAWVVDQVDATGIWPWREVKFRLDVNLFRIAKTLSLLFVAAVLRQCIVSSHKCASPVHYQHTYTSVLRQCIVYLQMPGRAGAGLSILSSGRWLVHETSHSNVHRTVPTLVVHAHIIFQSRVFQGNLAMNHGRCQHAH